MRGCEGPAEFTINCGMYKEMHHGTWEAPEVVSLRREQWRSTLTGKASAPRWRMQRSTQRWREATTWGRSARKGAAHTGNFCRTCRVGAQEPTSLWGIATQETIFFVTEASTTEELCEGTRHAEIWAGEPGDRLSYRDEFAYFIKLPGMFIYLRGGPISKACISAKRDAHLPFRRGLERNPVRSP